MILDYEYEDVWTLYGQSVTYIDHVSYRTIILLQAIKVGVRSCHKLQAVTSKWSSGLAIDIRGGKHMHFLKDEVNLYVYIETKISLY
jgi:hypothetical protein